MKIASFDGPNAEDVMWANVVAVPLPFAASTVNAGNPGARIRGAPFSGSLRVARSRAGLFEQVAGLGHGPTLTDAGWRVVVGS